LALRSRAFCVIAMVADGLTRERTSARKATDWRLSVGVRVLSGAAIVRRVVYGNPRIRAADGPDACEGRRRPDAPPAHEVTRLSDFKDLGALLRNFFRRTLPARSDAPKDEDRRPTGPFRLGLGEVEKRPKRKAHFAKRNETFRKA
jgi:hypothetical protein